MAKIVVCGAGGAPSEGVIRSLQESGEYEVIGFGADPADLICSAAKRKVVIPYADDSRYRDVLLDKLAGVKPDLIHFQNDLEVLMASSLRGEFEKLGIRTFMPSHETIETCTDKYKSYLKFVDAGLTVPKNLVISNVQDVTEAFRELKGRDGRIWIRDSRVGGGGKGSLSTSDPNLAVAWIEKHNGWGHFLAAEHLTKTTFTWQSIWWEGKLVAAQGRKRYGWIHGSRSASGVTGVTQVGETYSSQALDEESIKAVNAVDQTPHGLYGVDFTLDTSGELNPTEINISRFFTTIRFFTVAGFNMPEIFARLALGESVPTDQIVNPLPNGLLWLRGMDREPTLLTRSVFEDFTGN